MSVYKHNYRAYTGKLTPGWARIFVLARYGYQDAWSSKITVGIFILCLLPCLVFLFAIYLANNPMARLLLGNHAPRILAINAEFFLNLLYAQFGPALVLAAWIAPRLITFDLADDALPILLSHPISRFGYVFGKWIALFTALSLVTWIPDLVLFAYQGYSSPQPWAAANLPIAIGLLAGAMIWIAFLSLLGLLVGTRANVTLLAVGSHRSEFLGSRQLRFGLLMIAVRIGGLKKSPVAHGAVGIQPNGTLKRTHCFVVPEAVQ